MRGSTKKPKRGRPSLGKKAKKRLNVMLSTPIAARFRASGDGNLSGGIEAAVPEFIGAKPKEIPNLKPQRMPNDPTPSGFEEKKRSLNDSTRKSTMDATVD